MNDDYKDPEPPEISERQDAIDQMTKMEDGHLNELLDMPKLSEELIGLINNFMEKPSFFLLSYITDFLMKYTAIKFEKYIDTNVFQNAVLLVNETTPNEDAKAFLNFTKSLTAYPNSPFHTLFCDYGIIDKLLMIYNMYSDLQDYVMRLFSLFLYDNIPNHQQTIVNKMIKIAIENMQSGEKYEMFKYSLEFIFSCCKNAPYFSEKIELKVLDILTFILNGVSPKLLRFALWSYYYMLNNKKSLINEVNSQATISLMLIFDSNDFDNIRISLMIMDLLFSYQSIHNYVINFDMFFAHILKLLSCDNSFVIISVYSTLEKAIVKINGLGDKLLESGIIDHVNQTLSEGKHFEKQAAASLVSALMYNTSAENVANLLNDPNLDMLYHYIHDSDDPTFIRFANGIIAGLQKCDNEGISEIARSRLNELDIPALLEELLEDCEDEEKQHLAEFVLKLIVYEEIQQ